MEVVSPRQEKQQDQSQLTHDYMAIVLSPAWGVLRELENSSRMLGNVVIKRHDLHL